jgi:molybdopterin/thiamine biosynthesis adenylyltransferase
MSTSPAVFSRERLAGYEPAIIERAVVLVAGLGALGQNLVVNLGLAGVGEIRGVDNDRFEEHNQTRSPLYPTQEEQEELGLAKANVVMTKLRPLMTSPNARSLYADALIQDVGDGAFDGVDVIASCVDNASARAYLADRTRYLGIPLVEAGFQGSEVSLSCYSACDEATAETTPCWRCSHQEEAGAFSCRFYAQQAEEAGIVPAIQTAAAVLAGLQAEAVIQALHGEMPLAAKALDMDIRTGRGRTVVLAVDPECPGIHRSLERADVSDLEVDSNALLSELVAEITGRYGASASFALPAPFVWTSHCTACGRGVEVRSPAWRWMTDPQCQECGGPFERSWVAADHPAVIYTRASAETPTVLSLSASTVGLVAGSIIEIETPESAGAARISGDPTRRFSLVR